MASAKQRKVAKLKLENLQSETPVTDGKLVEMGGYGPSMVKNPYKVMDSLGVKEALADYGFNEDSAKQVVASILHDETKDANARLKASDMIFKVHGTYAPEKSVTATIDLTPAHNSDTEELARQYEEQLKLKILNGTPRTNIDTPLDTEKSN